MKLVKVAVIVTHSHAGNAKLDDYGGCGDGSNHQDDGSMVLAMVMLIVGTFSQVHTCRKNRGFSPSGVCE